ncbi:hypothetical protein PSEUDO8AS_100183 [Pseudomonas sp. 8AS]|nr:hypothetical protein PSEUDO8AS_100183 [Pseudomonas sp. 8AS]
MERICPWGSPHSQAENNKTVSRQCLNWLDHGLIKATSAFKVIRLLLVPQLGYQKRANQQKQQARNNNKNKARTYLGGSFGSPSSFRIPSLPFNSPSPSPMLESASSVRSNAFFSPSCHVASSYAATLRRPETAVFSNTQCSPC